MGVKIKNLWNHHLDNESTSIKKKIWRSHQIRKSWKNKQGIPRDNKEPSKFVFQFFATCMLHVCILPTSLQIDVVVIEKFGDDYVRTNKVLVGGFNSFEKIWAKMGILPK